MQRIAAAVAAIVLAATWAPRVEARDANIAGGIQYVIQAIKEKEKQNGSLEDANRMFGKAVVNLEKGIANDPKDSEAWEYLGRAYGELDSAEQAGRAYKEAMARLADKPKILKRAEDNRDFFFARYYNEGLTKYKEATAIMKVEDIPNSTDPKAAEAKAKLAEAERGFRKALLINESKAAAYDNLAIMLALQGKFADAGPIVDQGLANAVPKEGDEYERLKQRKDSLYNNRVVELLKANDYDGALTLLDGVLERNPNEFAALSRAAQTAFEKAQKQGEAKDEAGAKATYKRAADYFSRASAAAPDETNKNDMKYNQAIAAQQAGEAKMAAEAAYALVQVNPKELSYHRVLRGAYDKMGAQKKVDEQTWVILGLNENATVVADIPGFTAKVPKTSEAGKLLAELGPPDEIRQFVNGDLKVDVFYWWTKKRAAAFTGGRQVGTANFGEFAADVPAPTKSAAKAGGK
jgi:tetratricopeptide (TPR) repeat protein